MEVQMFVNALGEQWEVEFGVSARLTRIDGFLMTYGGTGRIVLNETLTQSERETARLYLLKQLSGLPVDESGIILFQWEEIVDLLRASVDRTRGSSSHY